MYTWFKRLKKQYRMLMHAALLFIIIAIPTIYETETVLPKLPTVIWTFALFGECFLVLLSHKVGLDGSSSDKGALKKIQKMTEEELIKEREYLDRKLNEHIIVGPGIKLQEGEFCVYKGEAETIYDPGFLKYYLGDLCPELERDTRGRCPGLLYITNMRVIMESAFYSFKLDYPEILSAQHTGNTLLLLQKYDANMILTRDMKKIIAVFNLLNQVSMAAEEPRKEETEPIRDVI